MSEAQVTDFINSCEDNNLGVATKLFVANQYSDNTIIDAFIAACICGSINCMKWLSKLNGDIIRKILSIPNKKYSHCLHLLIWIFLETCKNGHLECCKLLVKLLDGVVYLFDDALICAYKYKHKHIITWILKDHAKKISLDIASNIFEMACKNNNVYILNILINYIPMIVMSKNYENAYYCACYYLNFNMIKWFESFEPNIDNRLANRKDEYLNKCNQYRIAL